MIPIVGATFSWLEVPEEKLVPLEHNHVEREETERFFEKLVRTTILGVRKGDPAQTPNIPLLISSLMEVEKPWRNQGFGGWNMRIGKVLGIDRCRVIGARVCQEMQFTLEEALELHKKYPHEDAFMELLHQRYKPN